jgi:hypothetical protein
LFLRKHSLVLPSTLKGTELSAILWQLNFQLTFQSATITIKKANSIPAHIELYTVQFDVINFVNELKKCHNGRVKIHNNFKVRN